MKNLIILMLLLPLSCLLIAQNDAESIDILLKRLDQSKEKERFDLLNQIGLHYAGNDSLFKAISYFKQSIKEGELSKGKYPLQIPYRSIGNLYLATMNLDTAFYYLKRSQAICENKYDEKTMLTVMVDLGELYARSAQFDSSKVYLQQALLLAVKQNQNIAIISILNTLANINEIQGNKLEAIELYLDASQRCKQFSYLNEQIIVNNNLGNLYRPVNGRIARYYYKKGEEIAKDQVEKSLLSMISLNLALSYLDDNLADSAIHGLNFSLQLAKETGDSLRMAQIYHAFVTAFVMQQDCNLAATYGDSLDWMIAKKGLSQGRVFGLISQGLVHHCNHQDKLALNYFEEALAIVRGNGMIDEEILITKALHDIYMKSEDREKALTTLERYQLLNDSIYSDRLIGDLIAIHQKSVDDELIAKIERENKQLGLRITRQAWILALAGLLVGALLIFLIVYRKKRAAERKKLLANQELLIELRENVNVLMDSKHLTAYNTSANEQAVAISKKISKVSKSISGDAKSALEKLAYEISIDLSKTEEVEFQNQFEHTHPHFYIDLSSQHPELSPLELRLCGLIRMDLSTKEIAAILNRSVGTIDNYRSTIRRKMKLENDENLSEILQQF